LNSLIFEKYVVFGINDHLKRRWLESSALGRKGGRTPARIALDLQAAVERPAFRAKLTDNPYIKLDAGWNADRLTRDEILLTN
jgi:hypothetical protein